MRKVSLLTLSLIEKWESGIPRMFDEFSRYGLAEPELVDMYGDFRVNFYRKGHGGKTVGINVGIKLSDTHLKILDIMKNNPKTTLDNIAEMTGLKRRTIERKVKNLRDSGAVERIGSNKDGEWIVK